MDHLAIARRGARQWLFRYKQLASLVFELGGRKPTVVEQKLGTSPIKSLLPNWTCPVFGSHQIEVCIFLFALAATMLGVSLYFTITKPSPSDAALLM
jgi:uncharacterized membrane protein YczE